MRRTYLSWTLAAEAAVARPAAKRAERILTVLFVLFCFICLYASGITSGSRTTKDWRGGIKEYSMGKGVQEERRSTGRMGDTCVISATVPR